MLNTATADASAIAQAITETLGLRHRPVALSFVQQQPAGIEPFRGEVPSACSFWRLAENTIFYAPADAHQFCPIGMLTMGLSIPGAQQHLMDSVTTMCQTGYLQPEEATNIPSVPGEKSGIVYGPYDRFPMEPDAVLVWVSTTGAMLLTEATHTSVWMPSHDGTATFGRPSCAAIPIALQRQTTTLSLGCSGMRIFTGIDDDLELAVLPRPVLSGLITGLEATTKANAHMTKYYTAQKDRFTSTSRSEIGG